MQKRYLLDSLLNLHRKILSENSSVKISYSLFSRMRPYFVLFPNLQSRDTCMCKLHENLTFIANKLLRLHLISSANLESLADSCSCETQSKIACMVLGKFVCKNVQCCCVTTTLKRVSHIRSGFRRLKKREISAER